MLRWHRWLGAAALGCALAAGMGCTDDDDDVIIVEEGTGALTVRWTVAGTTDPVVCSDFDAAEVELAIYDVYGVLWGVEYGACEWFETRLELPIGDWGVDATLVDAGRVPVTTTVPVDVRILRDTEALVDVDFPVDSIL